MKPCALCRQPALLFCESDRAFLCWECDTKVHGANFLVARHTRCLLCRVCQEPTPWKASGSQLGKTVSVCDTCASGRCQGEKEKAVVAKTAAVVAVRGLEAGTPMSVTATAAEVREDRGRSSGEEEEYDDGDDLGDGDDEDEMATDYDDSDSETDYSDDEEEEGEYAQVQSRNADNGEEEEDGENQVVPWSNVPEDAMAAAATEPPPPPSTAGSSSSDDADYHDDSYGHSPSARNRFTQRMTLMQADADEDFDGPAGGFAKRRMLARADVSPDLAPSYHNYQVC